MARRIVIDPVTRIEGHARITVQLGDDGSVEEAHLHVTELRGFEQFCVGRSFREMPLLTSRVCGICPVSHQLAAAQACDALLAVDIPQPARQLRRLLNLGQLVQSHALSLFHLSGPDLVLGPEADPAERNLLGLLAREPAVARDGIRLRRLGQEVIEVLAGRRIHAPFAVPGGVARPLSEEGRDRLRAALPDGFAVVERARSWLYRALERHREERVPDEFPTAFLALAGPGGALEHDQGALRFVSATGEVLADGVPPARYADHIAEAVQPWSYLKAPYYRPLGFPGGAYRVGPLARLNVAARCGTPRADEELAAFRQHGRGGPVLSSFHYHHARLIEILYALERMERLLDDPDLTSGDVLASARCNRAEGVGAVEAPRGTMFHHYRVDAGGLVTWLDLLIATAQNALPIQRDLTEIARRHVRGGRLEEPVLNRVEAGLRAFDPCLSCATHASGGMALRIELRDAAGALLDEVSRG